MIVRVLPCSRTRFWVDCITSRRLGQLEPDRLLAAYFGYRDRAFRRIVTDAQCLALRG